MRCFCRMRSASSSVVPTGTVTRLSFVITEPTSCARFFSNLRSRLVRIPVSREPRVTGKPEILYLFMISSACRSVMSGEIVTGSTIMPLSERFTRSTSSPWRSIGMLRCTMPMPPCLAMAMASRDSVTVSMAAEASGMFTGSLRAKFVVVSTSVAAYRGGHHHELCAQAASEHPAGLRGHGHGDGVAAGHRHGEAGRHRHGAPQHAYRPPGRGSRPGEALGKRHDR